MFINRKEYNKYDIYLFLLIVSLCFGGYGGALQVVRALTILLLPRLFSTIKLKGCGYAKVIQKGLLLIYFYLLLSFVWTPDKGQAIKELVYYPIHFFLLLEIIVFARFANRPFKSISRGWVITVLLCSVVAFWELTTGNHLSVAYEQDAMVDVGGQSFEHLAASVTFANFNNYNTFLCISFPWIFYVLIDKDRSFNDFILALIALVASVLVIMINASRGAALSVIIMLVVYYIFSEKTIRKNVVFLSFIAVAVLFLLRYGQELMAYLAFRVSDGGLTTDEARSNIWSNVFNAFLDSFGFGVGIGGSDLAIAKYAQGGTTSPHNLFLEILVQYGIIMLFVFVRFIFRLFNKSMRIEQTRKIVLMMSLIALPVYSIITSGYLLNAYFYAFFATMYVFAYYEIIKKPAPVKQPVFNNTIDHQ